MEKVQLIDIDGIKPYDKNPRKNEKAVKKVAKSLELYSWQQPIVVDRENVIVVGHTRWKAAKFLGMKTVPVVEAKKNGEWLSEAECKAYRIADNKTGEFASWDDELLKIDLGELKIEMPDFDLSELTGFTDGEISKMIDTSVEGEDDVPEPRKTDIRLGDIYRLGEHRLMCADCTDENAVQLLMDGAKADMVFTDPPYGMFLDADFSGAKSRLDFAKEKGILGGKKHKNVIGDHADFRQELITTIFKIFGYCDEIFLWGADYYSELVDGRKDGSWVVWDKRLDESADKMYGSTFELCWSKNKHKRMIARVKWAGIFGTEKEFDHKRVHPTQKPTALVEWFFDYYSMADKKNVVDVFLGSGTTLIACEKTGRKCYGMEIDPSYCQVIIDRWQAFTGKQAVKLAG